MDNENNYQNLGKTNFEQEFISQVQNSPNNLSPNPPAEKPNKKIFWIILIVVVVLITVGLAIGAVLMSSKKESTVISYEEEVVEDNFFKADSSKIEILVAPTSATITIDGKQYKNGEYELSPGQYEVSIEKNGFETYNSIIVVADQHKTYIATCLTPNQNNEDYYETHPEDSGICQSAEELASASAWDQNALLDNIFEFTPFHNDANGYYVDPYYNDEKKLIVKITFKNCTEKAETLRDRAYMWMREQNLNPDNYTFEESWNCED